MFLLESRFKKERGNRKFGSHFIKDFFTFTLMKPTNRFFFGLGGRGEGELGYEGY